MSPGERYRDGKGRQVETQERHTLTGPVCVLDRDRGRSPQAPRRNAPPTDSTTLSRDCTRHRHRPREDARDALPARSTGTEVRKERSSFFLQTKNPAQRSHGRDLELGSQKCRDPALPGPAPGLPLPAVPRGRGGRCEIYVSEMNDHIFRVRLQTVRTNNFISTRTRHRGNRGTVYRRLETAIATQKPRPWLRASPLRGGPQYLPRHRSRNLRVATPGLGSSQLRVDRPAEPPRTHCRPPTGAAPLHCKSHSRNVTGVRRRRRQLRRPPAPRRTVEVGQVAAPRTAKSAFTFAPRAWSPET